MMGSGERSSAGSDDAGCPSREALYAIARGEEGDASQAEHAAGCEKCRSIIDEIRGQRAAAGEYLVELKATAATRAMPSRGVDLDVRADHIPGYTLLSTIHRGGQGLVCLAMQQSTDRKVAIKMLLAGRFATTRQRLRFEHEAEVVAKLDHPGIVKLFDVREIDGGRFALVMEYVKGVRLDVWARPKGRVGPAREALLRVFIEVCRAVHYAHLRGVAHRDLKPANILVDEQDRPRVIDFGIAQSAAAGDRLTLTGERAFTLHYASPEQIAGRAGQIDVRTDVYSLGVILYELVCGRLPFEREGSDSAIERAIAEEAPPLPRGIDESITPDLETVVLKAMQKEKERRYDTAAALALDVERCLAGEPIEARRDSALYVLRKAARRNRVMLWGAGLAALVLGAFGWYVAGQRGELRRLAEQLAAGTLSSIDSDRSLIELGRGVEVEPRLWEKFLGGFAAENLSRSAKEKHMATAQRTQALWALRTLYAKHPCLKTWRLPEEVAGDLRPIPMGEDRRAYRCVTKDWRVVDVDTESGAVTSVWSVPEAEVRKGLLGGVALLSVDRALLRMERGVEIWAIDEGRKIVGLEYEGKRLDGGWAVSQDGGLFWFTNAKNEHTVVEVQTGEVKSRWSGEPTGRADSVGAHHRITPGGIMVSYMPDGTLWVASMETPERFVRESVPALLGVKPVANVGGSGLAISNDGRLITVQVGETIYLLARDECLSVHWTYPVRNHKSLCEFSPDGTRLAVSSMDHRLVVLRVADMAIERELLGHRGMCQVVEWSEDPGVLVTSDPTGVVKDWDLSVLEWGITPFQDGGRNTSDAAMTRAGDLVIARDPTETQIPFVKISTRGETTGRMNVTRSSKGDQIRVTALDVSRDGTRVATGHADGAVMLLDTARPRTTGEAVRPEMEAVLGKDAYVGCVRFAPNGWRFASAHSDGKIRMWTIGKGDVPHTIEAHDGRAIQLAWHPSGNVLASVGADGLCKVWDSATGTMIQQQSVVEGVSKPARRVAWSVDGTRLAAGSDAGKVRVWRWNGQRLEDGREIEAHRTRVFGLAWSPDGSTLFTAADTNEIGIVDMTTWHSAATLEFSGTTIFELRVTPDGKTLAAIGTGGPVNLWRLDAFDRHIAGNAQFQLDRVRGLRDIDEAGVQTWAREVLGRPPRAREVRNKSIALPIAPSDDESR